MLLTKFILISHLLLVDDVVRLLAVLCQLGFRVGNLLPQCLKLLLLFLLDVEVLVRLLAPGEGVTLTARSTGIASCHSPGGNREAADRGGLAEAWDLAGEGGHAVVSRRQTGRRRG